MRYYSYKYFSIISSQLKVLALLPSLRVLFQLVLKWVRNFQTLTDHKFLWALIDYH